MEDLGKLTIVIFSRNRHEQLSRTLNYYKNLGIHSLVAHKTEIPLSIQEIPHSCTYLNINDSYSVRCGEISRIPKAEYSILSSDDERYLPSALSEMMHQLRQQSNQGSVGGRNIAIGRYGRRITGTETFSNLNNYVNFETNFSSAVNLHFHPDVKGVRIGALYRMYLSQNFNSLLRSLSFGGSASTPYIFECIAEIASLAIGPIRYIENLYWLRNWSNDMIQSTDWDRNVTFNKWWNSPESLNAKVELLTHLESELSISVDLLENAFRKLLKNRISTESRSSKRNLRLKINQDLKFMVKRLTKSKSLPTTLANELQRTGSLGSLYSEDEVNSAVKSML